MTRERVAARVAFLLDEAMKLGIKVGAANDGSEIAIATPPGLPRAVCLHFRDAILEMREAVIDHILVENGIRR